MTHRCQLFLLCFCFPVIFPIPGVVDTPPPFRKAALNLNLILHSEHGAGSHFFPIEAVLRRHRAKKVSRSQTSKPGRRAGRRSLEIGMETGEDTEGPSGPGDLGLRFGCASFNQDSTYVLRQSHLLDIVQKQNQL